MRLALFDLDNTLLSGDTDVEWLHFLIERGVLDATAERRANDEMVRRYQRGEADMLEFVRFYLRLFVPHDAATLHAWRERFVGERIVPRIPESARRLLEAHRDDRRVIITATNRFLTEPIAADLGIAHLIATEPELRDGRFTGDVAGVPCFREGKVTRIEDWLHARGERLHDYEVSYFYSDSINDLPLLERVTNPVAVDPDPRLAEIARGRRWPITRLAR